DNDDILNLLEAASPRHAAHQDHFARARYAAAANVKIVIPKCLGSLSERHVMLEQAARIEQYLVLFFQPAPDVDLRRAWYRTQSRFDFPVLQRTQFGQLSLAIPHEVVENLADASGDRPQPRPSNALRQLD